MAPEGPCRRIPITFICVCADTRRLVEAFLREDPEFARTLHESARERLPGQGAPALTPDNELKTLALINVAACFLVPFLVRLFKGRREVLIRLRR